MAAFSVLMLNSVTKKGGGATDEDETVVVVSALRMEVC